jgi:isocitrate lyase
MFGSDQSRWNGVKRDYTEKDIEKFRGSQPFELPKAKWLAENFHKNLRIAYNEGRSLRALGALTGNQAVQQATAGLQAIYMSGWQVAADNNSSGNMYPDQSLYPADSVPKLVQAVNSALERADQCDVLENGQSTANFHLPIVADAEAGFGGNLNAYELMKSLIKAGAAAVHFEDQLSSAKKCGHLGGKVLVPTKEFVAKLKAARLAADVLKVPTVIIARTDANSAKLITSDVDAYDRPFLEKPVNLFGAETSASRTSEGFYQISGGIEMAIARGLAYAPYADLLWCETSTPDLEEAKKFANAIHAHFPDQMLAYNCSPSFNWKKHEDKTGPAEDFQNELAKLGYVFQFVTLAGFHALNLSMFDLAKNYKVRGMAAYSEMQQREYEFQEYGFKAVKHQAFVGTYYFDALQKMVNQDSSTTAMEGSTEEEQF